MILANRTLFRKATQWLLTIAVLVSMGMSTASAGSDSSRWSKWRKPVDIVSWLEADGRFNTLLTALDAAELTDTLATAGPFTLLAPTDSAFATIPPEAVEALVADKAALTDVLLYHVIEGRNYSPHLIRRTTPATLQGNPVVAVREHRGMRVNGLSVDQLNVRAANGVIHVLDGVLLPPEEPVSIDSLADVLRLDGRFTTLLAAVEAAGLSDALISSPALTVFAPTDEAFGALPEGTVETLLEDPEGALADILKYHVLGEAKYALDLYRSGEEHTLLGEAVTITYQHWHLYVNDSKVVNPNVRAPNGYVQVIDSVLLPPEKAMSLVDLLQNDGRFTTLVAAVVATGLGDTLATGGPFTVFAPTDEAFDAVPAELLAGLLSDPDTLKQVLLYHVVEGDRSLAELTDDRYVTTLEGSKVVAWRWPWSGKNFINRSEVIDSNLLAENGRAQVINRVLLPRSIR